MSCSRRSVVPFLMMVSSTRFCVPTLPVYNIYSLLPLFPHLHLDGLLNKAALGTLRFVTLVD
jgi:hypothetical protein